MPGAASLVLANFLYSASARDGLAFGAVQRGMPLNPLYSSGSSAGRYDAARFTWIGSITSETGVLLAMSRAGLRSFADLFDKELIVGAPKAAALPIRSSSRALPTPCSARVRASSPATKARPTCCWPSKKARSTARLWAGGRDFARRRAGGSPLARRSCSCSSLCVPTRRFGTRRQRQILRLAVTAQLWGRPYVAPPDLPPERAQALRGAFQATMRDPAFLAEAEKMSFDIGPLSGEEMAGLIRGLYALPADIIQATREAFRGDRK